MGLTAVSSIRLEALEAKGEDGVQHKRVFAEDEENCRVRLAQLAAMSIVPFPKAQSFLCSFLDWKSETDFPRQGNFVG